MHCEACCVLTPLHAHSLSGVQKSIPKYNVRLSSNILTICMFAGMGDRNQIRSARIAVDHSLTLHHRFLADYLPCRCWSRYCALCIEFPNESCAIWAVRKPVAWVAVPHNECTFLCLCNECAQTVDSLCSNIKFLILIADVDAHIGSCTRPLPVLTSCGLLIQRSYCIMWAFDPVR